MRNLRISIRDPIVNPILTVKTKQSRQVGPVRISLTLQGDWQRLVIQDPYQYEVRILRTIEALPRTQTLDVVHARVPYPLCAGLNARIYSPTKPTSVRGQFLTLLRHVFANAIRQVASSYYLVPRTDTDYDCLQR